MPNEAQQKLIFDKLEYNPTSEQWAIHKCPARLRLVAGGERSGKSHSAAHDLMGRFFEGKLFWLVAADYERTRAEYDYICDSLTKLGINYTASKKVDPGEIIVEGGFLITTKSAKDPRKLAMLPPDGILVCEASQIDFETFLRLRGRLIEKRGWMLMSGTFESSLGWYVDMFNLGKTSNKYELESFSLPTWTNLVIFPGGRTDPEIQAIEAMSSPEWFNERFGGVPTPPRGLVFNEFRTHIHVGAGKEYEFDPLEPVYLWTDPGYAAYCAVEVVQKRGDEVFIVDEIYEKSLVTSEVVIVAKQKPWWNKVVGGAIDIAGTQHQSMPAPSEIWFNEGGVSLRSQKIRIQDVIERLKSSLKVNPITNRPAIHINTKCEGLISELGGCPQPGTGQTAIYKWRMDRDGVVVGDVPEDKNNHAIKATIYGLVDLIGYTPYQNRAKTKFF